MPTTSTSRIDKGLALDGVLSGLQPTGTVEQDAFGLVQAQLTYVMDSKDSQLNSVLTYYKTKRTYPYAITPELKSYRSHISFQKGGLMSVVVDFMGINTAGGISTYPSIQGVVATSAQPIESHPNFSKVTDETIGAVLAGTPKGTHYNNAIFSTSGAGENEHTVFGGFGVTENDADAPNPLQGIRHYLKQYTTMRGVFYVSADFPDFVSNVTRNVGRTLDSVALGILIPSSVFAPIMSGSHYLLSHAGVETIGNCTTNTVAFKVTYDIMYSGDQGWNADLYGAWLNP